MSNNRNIGCEIYTLELSKITLRINERGETDPMTIHVDESRIHRLILKIHSSVTFQS